MARWPLGVILYFVVVVAWAADPRGSARANATTDILDTIPADTVFYLGNSAGGDAAAEISRLALMPRISGLDSGMRQALKELQRDNTPAALFFHALGTQLLADFDGSMASLWNTLGFIVGGHYALYLHGSAPVFRAHMADAQTFLSLFEKATADSGLAYTEKTLGDTHLRLWEIVPASRKGPQVSFAIAVTDSLASIGFVSTLDSDAILEERFGQTLPADSLGRSATLSSLNRRYGFNGVATAFVNIEALARGILSPQGNRLGRDLQRYLPEKAKNELFNRVPAACQSEFTEMAAAVPRLVSGITRINPAGGRLDYFSRSVLELDNLELLSLISTLRGHRPSYADDVDDKLIAVGIGLDMDQLSPVLTRLWAQFTQTAYNCDLLVKIQNEVREIHPVALQALSGVLRGVKGAGLAVYDFALDEEMKPKSLSAILSFAVEDPLTFAILASTLPQINLLGLAIPTDGAAVELEHRELPAGIRPLAAIKGKHLVIFTGPEGTAAAETLTGESHVINGIYGVTLNYHRLGQWLKRERASFQLDDEPCLAKESVAHFLSTTGVLTAGTLDVTDNGIEIRTSVSYRLSGQPDRAIEPGRYAAQYLEDCQPVEYGDEIFNADGSGNAFNRAESGACNTWESSYRWRQSRGRINFMPSADRARDNCTDSWQITEQPQDESCQIINHSANGFQCLFVYGDGEPDVIIEYRKR